MVLCRVQVHPSDNVLSKVGGVLLSKLLQKQYDEEVKKTSHTRYR